MLELVISPAQKEMVKSIIMNHHSYVPTTASVGRRIDWLIHYENRIVGMIGLGSSVYPPPKDLLNYLQTSKSDYKTIFNNIANNWRFCMSERIPNLGTRILKELRTQAPIEWKRKYNNDLTHIITFVGANKDRKSTRLNSSHSQQSRMPSSA